MSSFLSDTLFKSFPSIVNMFISIFMIHILHNITRNCLLGKRKKIAKFLMRTFTYRSTFLYACCHFGTQEFRGTISLDMCVQTTTGCSCEGERCTALMYVLDTAIRESLQCIVCGWYANLERWLALLYNTNMRRPHICHTNSVAESCELNFGLWSAENHGQRTHLAFQLLAIRSRRWVAKFVAT
jgi:hypothetical protein